MRILFLSHYYAPEVNAPASRTAEHCRAWAAQGHEVTVVTCAPNHPHGRIYQGYRNRAFQSETVDGVRIIRVWTLLAANEGFARRILNYVSYLVCVLLALPFLPRADVVVSTSPQFFCGLAGMFVAPFKRAPWVLEIRDLWPESIVAVGAMRKGLVIRVLERLETLAYRRADAIVSLTRSYVPHLVARRGNSDGIVVIPNAADLTVFEKTDDGAAVRRSLGLEGKFVGAYVGTHGMAHGLSTILDCAEILIADPRFAFLTVGDGAERTRLLSERAARGLDNVLILGQRPKSEMPGFWSATDASLILLKRSDTFKKVLPSKMVEAMAMHCPIILGVEGEARDLLEDAKAGIPIVPEDAEQLAAAMRALADDPERAAAYGRAGRAFVEANFDRAKVAARYAEFLADVAARRSVSGGVRLASNKKGRFALSRAKRLMIFARYVPLRQRLRRLVLTLRRGWRDRVGWRARVDAPAVSQTPPRPIFPPRSGMILKTPEGLAFTFLNRTRAMPASSIDWNAPSFAPEHQLWRMNLHYMEYLEEVEDEGFAAIVENWIDANPPGRRGAWRDSWNAYALSLRVVVWMQQWALRGERIPLGAKSKILASLAAQLDFLEANLETDIGGNHLIKNIKALLWGSVFFEGSAKARWRRLGLRLLRSALKTQILADGVHFERSPSYHAQVFADLLECRHALTDAGAPSELDATLRAMAIATADLAHPDGRAAQFNDCGLSMAYLPSECLDVFQSQFHDRPAPRASFAFEAAGYFGRRANGSFFIADCGRIGPDALPAHAHGDILSFEWSVAGKRVIVDPGVYEYVAGLRRATSRAAASHNTVSFDGVDQAEFFGAFRCGRRPNVTVRRLARDAESLVLEGTHDGFGPSARHVRRFEVDAAGIRIVDRIEAPVGRRAFIGFLLHPEVSVEAESDGLKLLRGSARVKMRSDATIIVEDAVWWPDMGCERATKRLSILWDLGDVDIVTTFALQ